MEKLYKKHWQVAMFISLWLNCYNLSYFTVSAFASISVRLLMRPHCLAFCSVCRAIPVLCIYSQWIAPTWHHHWERKERTNGCDRDEKERGGILTRECPSPVHCKGRNFQKSIEYPSSLRSWMCICPCSNSIWFCPCPWEFWWFCDNRVRHLLSRAAWMHTNRCALRPLRSTIGSPHCPATDHCHRGVVYCSIVDWMAAMLRLDDVTYVVLRHSLCSIWARALLRRCRNRQLKGSESMKVKMGCAINAVIAGHKPGLRRLFRSVVHLGHVHFASGFDLIFMHLVSK